MSTGIVQLEQAKRALVEAVTFDEVKSIRDKAEAAREYAKRARLGIEAQNAAAELKIYAEIKAGEFLIESAKKGERYSGKGGQRKGSSNVVLLEDIGIDRMEAHRWQKMAALDRDIVDAHIEKVKKEAKELTSVSVLRLKKDQERAETVKKNKELVAGVAPVNHVVGDKYQAIVLDPPWDWSDEGDVSQFGRATPTYATMTIDQITALPIGELSQNNAHIYLWTTNRSLPKCFSLLDAWGFRYVTMITWCKPSFGIGNYFRGSTEQILFGVKGSLPLLRNDIGTWFQAKRGGKHSAKPDEFYKMVESCSPGPWVELFQRTKRNGWVGWGEAS